MIQDAMKSIGTAGLRDRLIAGLILFALGVGPVLTVFENRLLIWPGIALTAALLLASGGRGVPALWRTGPGRLLLAVPATGLVLAPLAFQPGTAAEFVLTTILPIFLAGGAMVSALPHLAARHRRWLLVSATLGVAATAIVWLVERTLSALPGCPSLWAAFGQSGCLVPSDFNQTACLLAVWTAPIVGFLWRERRRGFAAALAVAVGLLIWTSNSDSARVGLLAALLIAGLCTIGSPRRTIQALVLIFAFGTVSMPAILPPLLDRVWQSPALSILPDSGVHRLVIWEKAALLVGERPWTGWGYNNARKIGDHFGDISLTLPAPPGEEGVFIARTQVIPNHPHNAALEWWLDLGAVGTVLITVFVAASVWRGLPDRPTPGRPASRPPTPERPAFCPVEAGMAAALVAAFAIAQTAFGTWQPWWMTTLFMAALLARATLIESQAETAER